MTRDEAVKELNRLTEEAVMNYDHSMQAVADEQVSLINAGVITMLAFSRWAAVDALSKLIERGAYDREGT